MSAELTLTAPLDSIVILHHDEATLLEGRCCMRLRCKKCGHTWYPRVFDRLPRACPACNNHNWAKGPKRKKPSKGG